MTKGATLKDLVAEMLERNTSQLEAVLKFSEEMEVTVELTLIEIKSKGQTIEFEKRQGDYSDDADG